MRSNRENGLTINVEIHLQKYTLTPLTSAVGPIEEFFLIFSRIYV